MADIRFDDEEMLEQEAFASEQQAAQQPPQKKNRTWIIIAVVVALVLGGLGIVAATNPGLLGLSGAQKSDTRRYAIKAQVTAPGLDERGSRMSVHVAGTTVAGEKLDEHQWVDWQGDGLELPAGSYVMTFDNSPVAEDGTVYDVRDIELPVEVPESGSPADPGSPADSSSDAGPVEDTNPQDNVVIVLPVLPPDEVTDDIINDIKNWLGKDPQIKDVDKVIAKIKDQLENPIVKGAWVRTKAVTTDGNGYRSETIYELDAHGNATATKSTNMSGDEFFSSRTETTSYDERGLNTQVAVEQNLQGEVLNHSFAYRWEVDGQGRVTQLVSEMEEGQSTTTYEYDSEGNVVRTTLHDAHGYTIDTSYDADGWAVKGSMEGGPVGYKEYTYAYERDGDGRPLSCTRSFVDPATGAVSSTNEVTYTYDSNGNIVSQVERSSAGPNVRERTTIFEYQFVEDPSPWTVQTQRISKQVFSL